MFAGLAILCLAPVPSQAEEVRADCRAEGPLVPICGFHGPEDLAALPGGKALVVSEYSPEGKPGALSLLVPRTGERRTLYSEGQEASPRAGWGDPSCRERPRGLSPHGLSLRRRDDGVWMLAVVQHGGRESVEFFELSGEGEAWTADWRGCVIAPAGYSFNDVALFRDGGFVASDFTAPNRPREVHRWHPGAGFALIPGTAGLSPNGIQLAPNDRSVYVNDTRKNEIRRIDLATGKTIASLTVASPDNSTWTARGRLLIASVGVNSLAAVHACFEAPDAACPISYRIVEVDSGLRKARVIHTGGSSLMGLGTVGLDVNGDLFIGSAAGNRILKVSPAPK